MKERERRDSYRSGKHDYRNPSSDYSVNDIAGLLRRTAELDRHRALHPLLTKDFLLDLQNFGLLPSTDEDEDAEEEDGDEEDGYEEDDEWDLCDEIRSRTATMTIGSSLDEDLDCVRPTNRHRARHSFDMGRATLGKIRSPVKPTSSLLVRPHVRRWASPSSFRLKQLATPLRFTKRRSVRSRSILRQKVSNLSVMGDKAAGQRQIRISPRVRAPPTKSCGVVLSSCHLFVIEVGQQQQSINLSVLMTVTRTRQTPIHRDRWPETDRPSRPQSVALIHQQPLPGRWFIPYLSGDWILQSVELILFSNCSPLAPEYLFQFYISTTIESWAGTRDFHMAARPQEQNQWARRFNNSRGNS